MLNSGKKIRALRAKKKNILTVVLSKKKILNETKNHNPLPPLQVKWSVPNVLLNSKTAMHTHHLINLLQLHK